MTGPDHYAEAERLPALVGRHTGPRVPRRGPGRRRARKHRPGQTRRARMLERMEERWRRRQEGNGGMPGRTRS